MNSDNKHFSSRFLIVALFILGASFGVRAQSAVKPMPTPNSCPSVSVSSPNSVDVNSLITFTVKVSGGDPNLTPTFNWTVSAGTISFRTGNVFDNR